MITVRHVCRENLLYPERTAIRPGDHLAVRMGPAGGKGPWHHGIYMGAREVIYCHEGIVQRMPISDFLGRAIYIAVVDCHDVDGREKAMADAVKCLGCGGIHLGVSKWGDVTTMLEAEEPAVQDLDKRLW